MDSSTVAINHFVYGIYICLMLDPRSSLLAHISIMASYTAWQRVKVKVSEIADADDHDSCEVAFGFIEQILTKEGIKHIQGIWKKSVSSPFPPVKPKDNIWPKYTAALNSPRLRRYQDALLDLCLAEDTSRQQYYERIASARMWSARKDLVNACTMKNPGALDGEIQAYKDSHTVRGAKYVAAAEKFGKIYRYGDQYQQGPYGGEKLSRIKTFKHWEKQKSYGRLAHSLGEGILALIPTTGKYE